MREFFAKDWSDVVTGYQDLGPALETSLQRLGSTVSADTLIDYWFAKDARLVAHVVEDCRRLRADGFRIILTTNQEHRRAAYLMQDLRLGEFVDGIVYSAQARAQKPEPAFFKYAMERTGAPAATHLLVDDHARNVEAAKRLGWHGQVWSPGMRLFETVTAFIA